MARMDNNPKQRTSFGCPEDDLELLDQIVDEEDYESRAELLRELVAEKVEEYRDDEPDELLTPDREDLRQAYLKLLDIAEERVPGAGLRLTQEEAKNALYDNRTPKDAVMSKYVRPLKPDFVRVDAGMDKVWIVVRPPTPVSEVADEETPAEADVEEVTALAD